ncbi:ATP-binding protein [Streptomyces sp. NPDC007971]|uniref:ATP-binding protein n=1 Tax=Streptomyces sp. NPDC007971 TaxID=3364799 RepID=UPI0036EC7071
MGDVNQKNHLRVQLSATRRGARLARLLTERHLADLGVPFEEAVQVVAELAANAVLHGRVRGRDFRLGLALRDDGMLRIEVTDARGDRIPRIQDPAAQDPAARDPAARDSSSRDPAVRESESGRGLLIVAAYAHRWGVDGAPAHAKTVWAELTPGRGGA